MLDINVMRHLTCVSSVIDCHIINHPKFSGSRQPPFYLLRILLGWASLVVLLRVLSRITRATEATYLTGQLELGDPSWPRVRAWKVVSAVS